MFSKPLLLLHLLYQLCFVHPSFLLYVCVYDTLQKNYRWFRLVIELCRWEVFKLNIDISFSICAFNAGNSGQGAGCVVFERLIWNLCYLCCTTELSRSWWCFSLSLLFFSFSIKKFILLNRPVLIIYVTQLKCHVHASISLYLCHFSLFLLKNLYQWPELSSDRHWQVTSLGYLS